MKKYFFSYYGGIPAAEKQDENMKAWMSWIDLLMKQGVFIDGAPFTPAGYAISADKSAAPFSEFGNRINGYVIVSAEDQEKALEILKTCPHFGYNGTAELHEIMAMPK